MAELSDLETAIIYWLPELKPKLCGGKPFIAGISGVEYWCRDCRQEFTNYPEIHYARCPPLTRDLAMRLLEAMLRKLVCITLDEGSYENGDPARCHLEQPLSKLSADGEDAELTVAIVRAAAALARKEKGE